MAPGQAPCRHNAYVDLGIAEFKVENCAVRKKLPENLTGAPDRRHNSLIINAYIIAAWQQCNFFLQPVFFIDLTARLGPRKKTAR